VAHCIAHGYSSDKTYRAFDNGELETWMASVIKQYMEDCSKYQKALDERYDIRNRLQEEVGEKIEILSMHIK
jgi:hypothetical protein